MTRNTCRVGQRVEGGDVPADYDTGVVHSIDGDMATVGWDSGVVTSTEIDGLRPEGEWDPSAD